MVDSMEEKMQHPQSSHVWQVPVRMKNKAMKKILCQSKEEGSQAGN
jgi:hypothetical protein